MSIESILIILAAFTIGIGYLVYVQRHDIYEREPFFILLLIFIIGGAASVIISLTAYNYITAENTFVDSMLKIGPIEEGSKLLALIISYRIYSKHLNEIVDGLIYITAIALGFSIIENIAYAMQAEGPGRLLFYRSIFATIGHVVFAGYMGIAFYIHKKIRRNYFGLFLSLLLAASLHGLYDGVLFSYGSGRLFHYFFYFIIFLQIWFYKIILGFSKQRKPVESESFKKSGEIAFLYCNHCEKSIKVEEVSLWKIRAGFCSSCARMVLGDGHLYTLSKYYRPTLNFRRFKRGLSKRKQVFFLDPNQHVLYNNEKDSLSSDSVELNKWLAEENIQDRTKILNWPVIGWILKGLGLRFLR